jgi:hypothetical protein
MDAESALGRKPGVHLRVSTSIKPGPISTASCAKLRAVTATTISITSQAERRSRMPALALWHTTAGMSVDDIDELVAKIRNELLSREPSQPEQQSETAH